MLYRWPYFAQDPEAYKKHMLDYYCFFVEGLTTPLGYVHRTFIDQMPWPGFWTVDHQNRYLTLQRGNSFAERSNLMERTLKAGIDSGKVTELTTYTNEAMPVYGPNGKYILKMDGSGVDAFGVISFGVHMIGYVHTDEGIKYWVPRRAPSKISFPNMLDNTVGGSLRAEERPIDCMVRECEEELCLDPEFTRAHLHPCGTASYQMTVSDSGQVGCQHQVQYLYELEMPPRMIPKIGDGEVGEINLMTLSEVKTALANGEFKLNCAMTWISFLIRHGYITAENERDYVEICCRLHRKHDLFIV